MHALAEGGSCGIVDFGRGTTDLALLRVHVGLRDAEIRRRRADARGVDPKGCPSRKRTNVAIGRERFRYAAEQVKPDPAGWIGLARYVAAGEKRCALRGKPQRAA